MDFAALPGGELVEKGLADLALGRETVESLLVLIGAPRLTSLNVELPRREATLGALQGFPEHRLYELLAQQHQDSAHGRYNALVRRLVSFERALACVR
jgi:hypothetical protein